MATLAAPWDTLVAGSEVVHVETIPPVAARLTGLPGDLHP
jgi:hypothetical protein